MSAWTYKLVIGLLLALVGYFLAATYDRLSTIECGLARLQVDIASMRILSAEEVREIAKVEILRHAAGRTADRYGVDYPPTSER